MEHLKPLFVNKGTNFYHSVIIVTILGNVTSSVTWP